MEEKPDKEAEARLAAISKRVLATPPKPKKGADKDEPRRRLPESHQDRKDRRKSKKD
jgi:hypothetical protein